MNKNRMTIGIVAVLCVFTNAFADGIDGDTNDDNRQLDDIYRLFFQVPVDINNIESHYRDEVIHVGRTDTPLISGKASFMEINIAPMTEMVNSGAVEFRGTTYVVRRIVSGDMANDVGYLHSIVKLPDGSEHEQVQKYSWVFLKTNGAWQVVTDFDATTAPLTVLDNLEAEFVVK